MHNDHLLDDPPAHALSPYSCVSWVSFGFTSFHSLGRQVLIHPKAVARASVALPTRVGALLFPCQRPPSQRLRYKEILLIQRPLSHLRVAQLFPQIHCAKTVRLGSSWCRSFAEGDGSFARFRNAVDLFCNSTGQRYYRIVPLCVACKQSSG